MLKLSHVIFNSCLHVSELEYIKTVIPNHADEAVSGLNDDDSDDDDNFFVTKKRLTSSPLKCYLASDIHNASVFHGNAAPLNSLALKLNTLLPASAAVERLLSCGGLVMQPHRNRLTDDNFDSCLLLR